VYLGYGFDLNDPYYAGYSGKQWERDFDISSGSCNRQEIATVIGGVAGGVIANRVADEHKPVATLIGVIACREYTLVTVVGRDRSTQTGIACQQQPGVWQVTQ
jgi:hypothetical protein